jgi:hypothetical protein
MVSVANTYAFHVDLLPRVDLGVNVEYMQQFYQPLTADYEATKKIEGVQPANLSPVLNAFMSPWMLASHATEASFVQVEKVFHKYLNHWIDLCSLDVKSSSFNSLSNESQYLRKRDKLVREKLFSPIDAVWFKVDKMLGTELSIRLQNILRSQEE